MAKIVLVTTGQPSTNPRLVKEADALHEEGHEVVVLYSFWADWAQRADEKLLENKQWTAKQIGGAPNKNKFTWFFTRLRQKLATKITYLPVMENRAMCRAYDELLKEAINEKGDLYIGHNLGTLPLVLRAAKVNNDKAGFDLEDYHRKEELNTPAWKQKLKEKFEDELLPQCDYLTAASPLIAERYREQLNRDVEVQVVNNVFSKNNQPNFRTSDKKSSLKLFWFSQTIGTGRGLEEVICSFSNIPDIPIQLTLLGNSNPEIKSYFRGLLQSNKHQIHFMNPVSPNEIFAIAGQHDIGLATEQKKPENRNICLTNKIFTYLLAGNAILASSTESQENFLFENPGIGHIYSLGNEEQISSILKHYHEDTDTLNQERKSAWELGRDQYNWEVSKQYFLNAVRKVL